MQILIAEDDLTSSKVLVSLLSKMGHEVTVAADGQEALELHQAFGYRVVVTDWMMPNVDGLELCRAIRAASSPSYTYVMILTALTGKGRFMDGMEAGADDFLSKPVDPDELEARLRVAQRILGLQAEVRRLEGLLPICSYCKKIRNDDGSWTQVERFVTQRSEASFTHSICPGCFQSEIEAELNEVP